MVDLVEESMQASRRFILLYNASTFSRKRRRSSSNNNNNISKDSITGDSTESHTGFSYDDEDVYPDQRQQFEVVAGMHRALLEESLKVRTSIIFTYVQKARKSPVLLVLIWMLTGVPIPRWFYWSWKKSAPPSWPFSQSQYVTSGKSKVLYAGGRARDKSTNGRHV